MLREPWPIKEASAGSLHGLGVSQADVKCCVGCQDPALLQLVRQVVKWNPDSIVAARALRCDGWMLWAYTAEDELTVVAGYRNPFELLGILVSVGTTRITVKPTGTDDLGVQDLPNGRLLLQTRAFEIECADIAFLGTKTESLRPNRFVWWRGRKE